MHLGPEGSGCGGGTIDGGVGNNLRRGNQRRSWAEKNRKSTEALAFTVYVLPPSDKRCLKFVKIWMYLHITLCIEPFKLN
ncbi:hypothetical protein BRADI_4g25204v3 [Brachypodium distachyon]|uniref:Uncharacterized protein n=1 Tax=Brachypodium distachyon TaxID=15368 RepID=A0A2K2CQ53_BRADI|nr:hypothetical protein BRADI_4g25204v3 [Brachypodium distachyon]